MRKLALWRSSWISRVSRGTLWGVVLVLCVAAAGFGQEKIEDIIKNAPARGKYPDSSAVLVRSSQTFSLDESGTRTEGYFRALKVFTLTGREKFSDFRIPYDKNEEKIKVRVARTYKGDGTPVDVEDKAINDLTPPELAEADMYANILHRVLSFSAVDPGSVLVVDYEKVREKAGDVEGVVLFQFDEPVVEKELVVIIPGDRTLKYKVIGLAAGFEEKEESGAGAEAGAGRKIYRLVAQNSAQIKPEEYMPPLEEIASRAVFSTFADWKAAARVFAGSFYRAAVPSPGVKAFTEKLIKGAVGRDEKIKRIFGFVARDVRNVRFSFGEGGFEVHAAETVLKNRYGDWKDKSALLVAMLKVAGIEAYPVLVNSRAVPAEEDVPTLSQFDAVLVAVGGAGGDKSGGRGRLFLNPFADDSLFGYFREGRGSRGLEVRSGAVEFVPVNCLAEAETMLETEISGEIGADGSLKGKVTAELGGFFDLVARRKLRDMTATELDVFYKESVNKMGEDAEAIRSELSDARDLTKKLKISQEFRAEDFAIFQGEVMLIHVPWIPYAFAEVPAPSLAGRHYPFRLPGEMEVRYVAVFKVPAGFKPLYLPEGFSFEKDYGSFSLAVAYDASRSSVVVRKTMIFKKREIGTAEYQEFKKIMESFGTAKTNLILLTK